ncbi:MAG TPA: hypothetical protein VKU41_22730 [Polyangiaceae bacterium]|nr:hypothetical protein [Polyangiaceae bacterium]
MTTHRPAAVLATCAAALATIGSLGCSSLSPPFDKMKDSPMTVYRLQNFEPPAQAPAAPTSGFQLPPQIAAWVQAGASLLPPGLLPPGLIPGTAPAAPTAPTDATNRFHGFRILGFQQITDPSIKSDIVDAFGHSSNFQNAPPSCMFAEFGFAIANPNAPTPADILVSLSCQQVQAYNFSWPYAQTGITPDTDKKIAAVAQRVFAGR